MAEFDGWMTGIKISNKIKGFESRWMSVELVCYVKTIIVFTSFTTSFVDNIL